MPNGSSGEGVGVQEKQLQSVSGKNDIVSIVQEFSTYPVPWKEVWLVLKGALSA